MDKARVLATACDVALGTDIFETDGKGDGFLWDESKAPAEQMLEFDTAPEVLNGSPLAVPAPD